MFGNSRNLYIECNHYEIYIMGHMLQISLISKQACTIFFIFGGSVWNIRRAYTCTHIIDFHNTELLYKIKQKPQWSHVRRNAFLF